MRPVTCTPRLATCALASCLLLLASCTYPAPLPPSPTPLLPASPTSLALSPTPPATPTPVPPPATAVAATVQAGGVALAARSLEPLCLLWRDTDDDDVPEWVGTYLSSPITPPSLLGFVLDGEAWYDLVPPENEEIRSLGTHPTCDVEVRDLNGDGRTEVAIWGRTDEADRLHIFTWDGTGYALLGAFEGPSGIRIEETDGDLVEEVIVRLRPDGDLVWEIVYTWDGSHYAWTWDRYAWYYPDRPHALLSDTPIHAVASFYLALNDRDLPGAYNLLSPAAQAARPYETWSVGFATTLAVEVSSPRVVGQGDDWATVAAQVRAVDNVQGRIVATLYDVEWQLVWTDTGWRLDSGTMEPLEQRELPYYR